MVGAVRQAALARHCRHLSQGAGGWGSWERESDGEGDQEDSHPLLPAGLHPLHQEDLKGKFAKNVINIVRISMQAMKKMFPSNQSLADAKLATSKYHHEPGRSWAGLVDPYQLGYDSG